MALLFMVVNILCTVVQTVALVVMAFELSPWRRKDDAK